MQESILSILSWLPLIFWLILWFYWIISAFRAKKSIQRGSWWLQALGIRLAMLIILFFVLYTGHDRTFGYLLYASIGSAAGNILLSVLGVLLCATGVAFAIWARASLGTNWGMPMTLREKPEFVMSGPYKFVRHPIYSGFLLAMLGTALVEGPIWLIILILVGIYFIYSAKMEEKNMLKQFPHDYPEYMRKSKMLIPFVF